MSYEIVSTILAILATVIGTLLSGLVRKFISKIDVSISDHELDIVNKEIMEAVLFVEQTYVKKIRESGYGKLTAKDAKRALQKAINDVKQRLKILANNGIKTAIHLLENEDVLVSKIESVVGSKNEKQEG